MSSQTSSSLPADPFTSNDPWALSRSRRDAEAKPNTMPACRKVAQPKSGEKDRGFWCRVTSKTLTDCKAHIVVSPKAPLLQKASAFFGCHQGQVKVVKLKSYSIAMCYLSDGTRKQINYLASRINWGVLGNQKLIFGDALYFAVDSGWENLSKLAETVWKGLDDILVPLPGGWPAQVDEAEEEESFVVFISVDGRVEEIPMPSDCKGFNAVALAIESFFTQQGSKAVKWAESSSDEEDDNYSSPVDKGTAKIHEVFQSKGLNNGFIHDCKDFNVASVNEKSIQQYALNRAAAYFVGRMYGDKLHFLIRQLWGDVIFWSPGSFWVPEEAYVKKFTHCVEDVRRWSRKDVDLEAEDKFQLTSVEIEDVCQQQEMKNIMQRYTHFDNYTKALDELECKAQREDWSNRLPSASADYKMNFPYLDNYIRFMFAHSIRQNRGVRLKKSDRGSTQLVFATGLLSMLQVPIYGIFESKSKDLYSEDCAAAIPAPPTDEKFRFKEWTMDKGMRDKLDHIDLLSDECLRQGCEDVNLELHELKGFDPYTVIEIGPMLPHIISKMVRFEEDNKNHNVNVKSGWSLTSEKRAQQFNDQLFRAKEMCRSDRSIAVMTCYSDGAYQWLLPVPNPSQVGLGTPTLTAVLRPMRHDKKDKHFVYQVKTVLTLDHALKQARLCGLLNQRWTVGRRQGEMFNAIVQQMTDLFANKDLKPRLSGLRAAIKNYGEHFVPIGDSTSGLDDEGFQQVKYGSSRMSLTSLPSSLKPQSRASSRGSRASRGPSETGAAERDDDWRGTGK